LPDKPKLEDFPDEESFLEARDSWRHRVLPLKRGVRVGEAFQQSDGSWEVTVNETTLVAPDLETAKRSSSRNMIDLWSV
jgi:hypothetical protein